MARFTDNTAGNEGRWGDFGTGNEFLGFGAGRDYLWGGGQQDLFLMTVDLGEDTVIGNGGIDHVDYSTADRGVIVGLSANGVSGSTSAAFTSFPVKVAQLYSIENVTGTRFADQITGSDLDNVLDGGYGADSINGAGGNDTIVNAIDASSDTLDGGAGTDTLRLSGSYLPGEEGVRVNLAIPGLEANGLVEADFGILIRNPITGDSVVQTITVTDTIRGIENVSGTRGDDVIHGNSIGNDLRGGEGHDQLFAGDGADRLMGEVGDDRLFTLIDQDRDTIDGGSGVDTLSFENLYQSNQTGVTVSLVSGGMGTVSATTTVEVTNPITGATTSMAVNIVEDEVYGIENVTGTGGRDVIRGSSTDNEILGGAGDDVLDGRLGNDTLEGGTGNDTLIGGQGRDFLVGNQGADTFVIADAFDIDHIGRFEIGADRIDLSAFENSWTGHDLFFGGLMTSTNFDLGNDPLAAGEVRFVVPSDFNSQIEFGAAGGVTHGFLVADFDGMGAVDLRLNISFDQPMNNNLFSASSLIV